MSIFKPKEVSQVDYVDTDHGPIYYFFYSFWTHILQMMATNALFVIFNLPMLFVSYIFTIYILPMINQVFVVENFVKYMQENGITGNDTLGNDIGSEAAYQLYFLMVVYCVMMLLSTCLFCIGPFQAGFNQIYRNLRRGNGIFFFADFKEGMKENLKQSIIVMIVGIVVTFSSLTAIAFYLNTGTKWGTILAAVFVVLIIFFMLIQNIVYQMMVSRSLSVINLYRNAIIFLLLKFGPCLGIIAVQFCAFVLFPFMMILSTTYMSLGLYVFLYLFIVIAFVQYLIAFFTGGLLHQYMPSAKTDDDIEEEETDESETSEDDTDGND